MRYIRRRAAGDDGHDSDYYDKDEDGDDDDDEEEEDDEVHDVGDQYDEEPHHEASHHGDIPMAYRDEYDRRMSDMERQWREFFEWKRDILPGYIDKRAHTVYQQQMAHMHTPQHHHQSSPQWMATP